MAEIKGMRELRVNVGKLTKEIQEVLPTALKAGAELIRNDAVPRAPYKTGTLRRSIHIEEVSNTEVRVGTDVIYAAIQEYGGVINAKNAPWLTFKTDDGEWHRVKSVTIPAHPYLRPAMDENREKVIDKVKAVIQALIK